MSGISNAKSANQLIDEWAKAIANKPLKTAGSLSMRQKTPSAVEMLITAPLLVRDSSFLMDLQNHYRVFLDTPLILDHNQGEDTDYPTLAAERDALGIHGRSLRGLKSIYEEQETQTNEFHQRLLHPLSGLARVSLADCGSTLAGVSADDLDESIRDVHPDLRLLNTVKRGELSVTPDHTFLSTSGDSIKYLVTVEDKNTALGESKYQDLEAMVNGGSIKHGASDAANVWKQASP
jgi:hypothetical protein